MTCVFGEINLELGMCRRSSPGSGVSMMPVMAAILRWYIVTSNVEGMEDASIIRQ